MVDRRSCLFAVLPCNSTNPEVEIADLAQAGQIDLGVHLRGGQRNMAEMICDLLERNSFGQQMRRAGVPQCVWAIAW